MPSHEIRRQVDRRLHELHERHLPLEEGSVASYYAPGRGYYEAQLANEERDKFGISLADLDGGVHCAGDHSAPFALQSLSKVFAYSLALEDHGRDRVLEHVGVEPSGDAFNSIVFDERSNRPYNPMVNAGALVTTDLVRGRDPVEKLERLLGVMRVYAGNSSLGVDWEAFQREIDTADRNRATTYLMRSLGMIGGDAEAILALYLQQCSVSVTCRDLAVMAATLANGCVNPVTGERALTRDRVRDVLSVLYTCGMYDAAGQWAFDVGVPAKSGVSGGIFAPIPEKMGLAVFSPGLDVYGNSVRGVRVCQEISGRLGLHVFATEGEDAILGAGPAAA
ncbi:MAG: glutaminase A [Actinomycetota bacterium]|nr:glutaminase A [Actinomycetota bacterium]